MLKSIIEEIYSNNESVCEQIVQSEKHLKAADEAYKFYKQLIETLNDEQKNLLENFADKELEATAESEFTNFKEGMKIGFLLAVECLS